MYNKTDIFVDKTDFLDYNTGKMFMGVCLMKTVWVGCSPHLLDASLKHNHGEWEILLNLEGTGTAKVGDESFDFFPGSIMCIPPLLPHSKTPVETFRDIYMSVTALPFKEEVVTFTDDKDKTVETLMLVAYRAFQEKRNNYEAVIDSISSAICHILMGWYGNRPQSDSIEQFKRQLHNQFTNPAFCLSDAMKATAYNSDYFRRCFKAETGLCPIEYLNHLRIDYAKHLLMGKCYTKKSIAEIALQSGYSDFRYFSKVFKKQEGITPHEFAVAFITDSRK